MKKKLKIEKAHNGYIVEIKYQSGDVIKLVSEECDNEYDETVDLLETIVNELAPYSRKRRENVHVFKLPGLEYEGSLSSEEKANIRELIEELNALLENQDE